MIPNQVADKQTCIFLKTWPVDKLYPDTKQMTVLITQLFDLGGTQTPDLFLSSQGHRPLDQHTC